MMLYSRERGERDRERVVKPEKGLVVVSVEMKVTACDHGQSYR